MSTIAAEPTAAATTPAPALARPNARLWTPIGVHSGVDFFSFVTISLMPLLAVRLGMTPDQKAYLLMLGGLSSGAIQPLVAWASDRLDTRALGTVGVVLASLAVPLIGWAQSLPQLVVLYFVGVVGVGAFHPPAAASVGQLAGRRRSLMLSVFFLFGMIGGISGNVLSPQLVELFASFSDLTGNEATSYGLRALVVLAPLGLVLACVLAWAIHPVGHRHTGAHESHATLPASERARRWRAFWLLYVCNAIRFATNLGLVYLFIEWTERLTRVRHGVAALDQDLALSASAINGPLQGSMQVGMGFGGILLGFLLRPRLEKPAFIAVPLLGAVCIVLFPYTDRLAGGPYEQAVVPAALAMGVLCGFGFGSVIPVALSLGQRLLPHRTGFASGIMLGGAWCMAAAGPLVAKQIHANTDANLEPAFLAAAGAITLAAVLGCFLPGRLLREIAPH